MNTAKKKHYAALGVSAQKEDVHKAIANLDKGLDRYAFCKLIPDHALGGTYRRSSADTVKKIRKSAKRS